MTVGLRTRFMKQKIIEGKIPDSSETCAYCNILGLQLALMHIEV